MTQEVERTIFLNDMPSQVELSESNNNRFGLNDTYVDKYNVIHLPEFQMSELDDYFFEDVDESFSKEGKVG